MRKKPVSIQEVCNLFGVHADTIRNWEEEGLINVTRTPGGHRRYDLDEVKSMISNSTQKLSLKERELFYHIICILERTKHPDFNDNYYKDAKTALMWGFESHYPDCVHHEVFTKEQSDSVLDTLNMFSAIQNALQGMGDTTGIETYRSKFLGYDGNFEGSYMSYAEFYCNHDGGRFKYLDIKNFNSHCPMVFTYSRMVDAWELSENKFKLSKEDVVRITNTR